MAADFDMDQLLLAFNIDLTPMKTAAQQAEKIIDDLEAKWAASSKAGASTGAETVRAQREVKDSVAQVIQSTQQAVSASKDQAKATTQIAAELRNEILQHAAKKAAIAAETAEIALQTAELRKQRLEQAAANRGGGEGSGEGGSSKSGFIGNAVKGLTTGLLGDGMMGEVAAGVVGGEAIAAGAEAAIDALKKFGESIREAVSESSRLANVRNQFDSLAKGAGVDMPEALEKMRAATNGTVEDLQLLRLGSAILNSGIKMNGDQMAQYTKDVVALARGTGHTAVEAVEALNQTMLTGRAQALASVVGLNRYRLVALQIGNASRGAARGVAETTTALAEIHKQAEAVGAPALTLDDHLQRLSVSFHNLFEEFAAGLAGSQGLSTFGDALDAVSAKFESMSEELKPLGATLGNVFASLVNMGKSIWSSVTAATDALTQLGSSLLSVADKYTEVKDASGNAKKEVSGWAGIGFVFTALFGELEMLVNIISGAFRTALAVGKGMLRAIAMEFEHIIDLTSLFGKALSQIGHGDFKAAYDTVSNNLSNIQQAYHDRWAAIQKDVQQQTGQILDTTTQQLLDAANRIDDARWKKPKQESTVNATTPAGIKPQFDASAAEETARLRLQLLEAEAKERLDVQAGEIAAERNMDQLRYQNGLETLEQYIKQKKELNDRDHQNRIDQINADADAQVAEAKAEFAAKEHQKLQNDNQIADLTKQSANASPENRSTFDNQITTLVTQNEQYASLSTDLSLKLQKIAVDKRTKITLENTRENEENFKDDLDNSKMRVEVAQKTADALLKIKTKQITDELALDKKRFDNTAINPQQYMAAQLQAANAQAEAAASAAASVYNAGPKNDATMATYQSKVTEAVNTAQDKITNIMQQQTSLQIEYIERVYSTQQKAIDLQLQMNKDFGGQFKPGNTDDAHLLTDAISKTKEEIAQYEAAFNTADPTERYSKNWFQIVDNTEQAYIKLQNYNEELAKTLSISTPIGNVFETLGNSLSSIFANAGPLTYQAETASRSNRGAVVSTTVHNTRAEAADVGSALTSGGQQLANIANIQEQIKKLNGPQVPPEIAQMISLSKQVGDSVKAATDPVITGTELLGKQFNSLSDAAAALKDKLNSIAAPKTTDASSATPTVSPFVNSSNDGELSGPLGLSMLKNMGGVQSPMELETPSITSTIDSEQAPAQPGKASAGGASSATDGMGQFAAKTAIAVQGLTSFITSLTSAKSALSGMIQGAAGGASAGSTASGLASSMGADMSGALGQAMPGIGAALGMIMGGIMGQKNAMVQQELGDLKQTYQEINEQYTSGNATLAQTIASLQSLISQAEADMASSKKGGSQFQDLINQYNQQLQQYLDQQAVLMRQMSEQVALLTLPNEGADYGQYISSLQSVIEQYEQYAGAATTAAQTMQAQTYLQQSLASYQEQWTQQLQQDNTQAVQDALQLNQLQQQRNELLQQTAQNERDVMEQGVLTRQQTFAQSKAQKLADTQYQANLQLEQMNNEIALAQAKVTAEQQVFDLATTRIGLEAQLLQLQEAQTGRQMQSTQALANLVSLMNGGISSNGSALSSQNDFITNLLAALTGSNASASTIAGLLATYNQYASSGLGNNGTTL